MATRKPRVKYPPPDVSVPGNVRVIFKPTETEAEYQEWLRGMDRILAFGRKARLEQEAKAAAASISVEGPTAPQPATKEVPTTPADTRATRTLLPKDPARIDAALQPLLSMRKQMTIKDVRIALDLSWDEAKDALVRLVVAGRAEVVRRGVNGTYRWLPTPGAPAST